MDIYKLNELNDSMLEEDSTEAVKRRLSYAQMIKNYMKALVLDTTDEYAQKQIHFSGLAELKEDARIDMAADTRIQITKLFGMTPAGFNSGESDRATYNDMVEAEVRFPCEPNMIRVLEVVGRKVLEKTLDWDFEWPELERMSKYDEAKMKADIETYGLYTYDDFSEYCSYEAFVAFGLENFKVAVGKGYITFDEIIYLISLHAN